jgi:hypothetical protein
VELRARDAGVEDVVVHCDDVAGGGCALRVATEHRGYWTLAARMLPEDPALRSAFDAVERGLRAGVDPAALGPGGDGWRLQLLQHLDLETNGDYLAGPGDGSVAPGAVAAAVLERRLPDGTWAALADTYRFGEHGVERLTGAGEGAGKSGGEGGGEG